MKLNYPRTIFVGFAFFLICTFWQAYDTIIPKILTDKFGMTQAASGIVMALDNILALFLLPLFGTAERIPLLTEAFDALGGRAPLIVELKTGGDRYALCARTLKLLRSYGGPYCVESFDPYIVRWFYRNAPDVMRGQLAEQMRRSRPSLGLVRSLLLSRTLTNCLTRPHFVAYRVGPLPWPVRLCAALGALVVGWTARPDNGGAEAAMRAYGAVIFEHCRPPARY